MHRRSAWSRLALLGASALAMVPGALQAQAASGEHDARSLEQQFQDPPASARPRAWWAWMNGNVTEDAIVKDLEWFKRIGVAGVHLFEVNQRTPKVVDQRLTFMTPAWQQAIRRAATEADRLGLEMGVAASSGWSETGAPWVTPEDAIKKLVWSETEVTGRGSRKLKLPRPPGNPGPFGNLPAASVASGAEVAGHAPADFYRDIAVLAYPVKAPALPVPAMRLAGGDAIDASALIDDDLSTGVVLPKGKGGQPAAVEIAFSAPQTVRSATIFAPGGAASLMGAALPARLEASDDGMQWRSVVDLSLDPVPSTSSFPAVTAAHFRLVFDVPAAGPGVPMLPPGIDLRALADLAAPPQAGLKLLSLRLGSEDRVNRFEAKAGFSIVPDYYALDRQAPSAGGIPAAAVIDLTGRMAADGTLNWKAPAGRWRVVRLGWSLTGKTNHPAPDEAVGLEVDKLDASAVQRYADRYISVYREAAGKGLVGQRGIDAIVNDSTEVGAFNWTPAMIERFKALRGYDPTPWLPALTGAVVASPAASNGFLYDFRRTIADLHASEHYGTMAQAAHANGMAYYSEALENGRPSLGDDIAMRKYADYPMGAMWYAPAGGEPSGSFLADLRGAASTAHIYGKPAAAAESLTSALSPWGTAPADLQATIDLILVSGVTQPAIAWPVLQPSTDKAPGLSLGIFGQYFNRLETWADMARPWIDYIARNSLLLQQGRNVADVAYFYGEEAPLVSLFRGGPAKDAPSANAYDFIGADGVVNELRNDGSDLVTPGGARYRVLYLGGTAQRITVPVLRRIAALVEGGATVVGTAPEATPSLADDPAEFAALVAKLWPGGAEARVGKGRVIAGRDVDAGLRAIGAAPAFRFSGAQTDSRLLFLHRASAEGDSFFVVNRRLQPERGEARFRVSGKAPELWHADSGIIEPLSYRIEGDETVVPLDLAAADAVHIVFRTPAGQPARTVASRPLVAIGAVTQPWTVTFQTNRGAPASTRMAALAPLDENADPAIRYFSGVATYATQFIVPARAKPAGPLWLDLGKVGDVAEVRVNGKVAGTVWHAPYRIDIAALARPGRNSLEVRVANLWVNRLIGDAQPGAAKVAYTTVPTYLPSAPLRPAGLIGPVTLLSPRK